MRVFVYEFVTAGGFLATPDEPIPMSLLAEGHAMVSALAGDFAALPGVEVMTLVDHRLAAMPWPNVGRRLIDSETSDWSWFTHLARAADWTIVIAPEFDQHLQRRAYAVEGVGGRLLGPSAELVELAGNKTALCAHLADAGLPVSQGILWQATDAWPEGLDYPVVLKPNDGAGSLHVRQLLHSPGSNELPRQGNWRIENYYSGMPASVAVIAGADRLVALPPCRQRLSADGRLAYLGGALPIPASLASRARQLALRVAAALPRSLGYFGIDLVLGDDPQGKDDCIIEVNPRLTTSYIGLRAACRDNLAGVMLAAATGQAVDPSWRDVAIEFDASGEVRGLPQ